MKTSKFITADLPVARRVRLGLSAVFLLLLPALRLPAESGYEAWLRYPEIQDRQVRRQYSALPAVVVASKESEILHAAQGELIRGVRGMLNRTLRKETALPEEPAVLLGTFDQVRKLLPSFVAPRDLSPDGFWLTDLEARGHRHLVVTGPNDRGVLYGTFALLRRLALHQSIARLDHKESPYAPVRFLNHWDNLDGTIERGYAGRSIFFDNGRVLEDLGRVHDYGRLLASVGINGCSINNVNADARLVTPGYLADVARIAGTLRPWGVRLLISLDFASPRKVGGIDSFDPLDPRTVSFWRQTVDEVYRAVPDLAGFVLKADSEGRLGPSEYGRTHADAANVIARAIKPHGGLLFYRGFVYNHRMDWRDPSLDRAKAAYDNFHNLDGKFEDNVIVQIKHGPIDFQVREPASPLFGGLEKTGEAIELQITQEYLGQQRHLCYVVPMWKEVLDFDLQVNGPGTPVKALVAGTILNRPAGGFVGVSNVGRDTNWLHHPLAMANLYGFGRLAWDPELSGKSIAEEWTRLTFGHDRRVVNAIVNLQLKSWPAYENYTGNLGIGTLTDIIHIHFGPAPESSEHNGWGQWHRSDARGTGMNRTVATGTGFIGQYSPPVARRYESLATCPDELLLFMHHVPYTHVLHSGKTVIQHLYDAHYQGAAEAAKFVGQWETLRGRVDEQRYRETLARLQYQADHAVVWRDAVCNWFFEKSGIADSSGRVGNHPNRVEAESMVLENYAVTNIAPFEAASGGKAVQITGLEPEGAAGFIFKGKPGWYDLAIQYFDEDDGISQFKLYVAGQLVEGWKADHVLPTPSKLPDAHTSIRRHVRGLALRPGDEIGLTAIADGGEGACVDYVEISPATK